jgi:tetratricopeptide (TPR) repeat protein
VLTIDPYYFAAYCLRAEAFRKLQKYSEAQSDIEFYLELFPDDKDAMYEAGVVTSESKNYLKALSYFNRIITKGSKCALCLEKRGNVFENLKMYEYAEKDYSSAILLQPANRELLFRRGVVRFAMNNKASACTDWKAAAKMNHFMASEYIQRYCK